MAKFKKINNIRRKLMHGITRNVGRAKQGPSGPIDRDTIKRVLISRPNHRLGNLLLITPLLQELETTFPSCKIDVFMKGGLGPVLFKNYKNIDRILSLPKKHFHHLPTYFYSWFRLKTKKYDLIINVDKNSSSGRLSSQLANGTYKIFGDIDEQVLAKNKAYEHLAKYPVYNLRDFLATVGFEKNEKPVPPLSLKLSRSEIEEGKKIVDGMVNNQKKTICIFTFATGNKCYSESWWGEFYGALKNKYGSAYNIVEMLPKENVSQIAFEAPMYYSQDIRQICAFIANTEVFIGADSGMMHLASASQTPIVGLFKATNLNKYGPYNANSVAIDTNNTSTSESMEEIDRILLK